jgi:hypothetical protein
MIADYFYKQFWLTTLALFGARNSGRILRRKPAAGQPFFSGIKKIVRPGEA